MIPVKAGMIANAVDGNGAVHNLLCADADAGPQPLIVGGLAADGTPQSLADAVAAGTNSASTSTTAATLAQGTKAVTSAGTPVLLVAVQTLVESVVITSQKNTTTANAGKIFIGYSATPGANLRILNPPSDPTDVAGQSLTIQAPAGKKLDLHTIYVDAGTNGDGVQWDSVN